MSEHPILFSAPMVRALLDGRKTQTRSVLKPQPQGHTAWQDDDTGEWWVSGHGEVGDTLLSLRWAPGDRLWVREGFALVGTTDPGFLLYRASGYEAECDRHGFDKPYPSETIVRWRPSIHMPRWASRITMEVEAVRVERLHDISEGDAVAEGCFFTDYGRQCFHQGGPPRDPGDCPAPEEHHPQRNGWMWDATTSADQCLGSARSAFGNLWEKINGPDAWNSNPWVSVTTLRRIT